MKGERPDWFPLWEGHYVAVIGGGNSVKRSEVDLLKDRLRVVTINESHQLAPWADALYSCDGKWWSLRRTEWPKFKGLKITADEVAVREFKELKKLKFREEKPGNYVRHILLDEWGVVGTGQGSGFQVVNWLAQLDVKGIALIGYDGCTIDNKIHWHGRHPDQLNNPDNSTFVAWKRWMENAAPQLLERGIEVVNCSMHSAIGGFMRFGVPDTLARWKL